MNVSAIRPRRLVAYLLLGAFTALNVYPFLWMVFGSFKTNNELLGDPGLLPDSWRWEVLATAWDRLNFFQYFGNSVIYTMASLIGIVLVYPMAAFAFARLEFRGRDFLFAVFVAVLLVPGIVSLIPLVIMIQSIGLSNTWPGIVIPTVNGAAPLAVFLMRNYFRSLPSELYDAARIDGASPFTAFWRIYLPLSMPALATILVLNAITIWNAYIAPSLILTSRDMFTLPLGLFSIRASAAPEWNMILAGSLIVVLPLVVILLVFQRYIAQGVVGGAIRD